MPDSNLNKAAEWPYRVSYGKENEVDADILILGGGVAGSHAAISAAKRGAKVVVVDKGALIRSGSGGAGVDHWHGACTNPCSTVTLEERRQLLLLVGETPLHIGHIRNIERLCEMGAIIMPPAPAFYHKPQTIQDIVDHTVGKMLDIFGVEHTLFQRWPGIGRQDENLSTY